MSKQMPENNPSFSGSTNKGHCNKRKHYYKFFLSMIWYFQTRKICINMINNLDQSQDIATVCSEKSNQNAMDHTINWKKLKISLCALQVPARCTP